jgi:hypothetical protein
MKTPSAKDSARSKSTEQEIRSKAPNQKRQAFSYRKQNMTPGHESGRTRLKRLMIEQQQCTHATGNMTAQPSCPVTRHSNGTREVESIMMPAIRTMESDRGNQNLKAEDYRTQKNESKVKRHLLAIFGISLKKFERWTSLIVADQDMLYETMCARIAWLIGIASPPKKKKLKKRGCVGKITQKDAQHSQKWDPHEILQECMPLQDSKP